MNVPMAVRAMKAGAIEVLTKPYKADELLSAIRQAIGIVEPRFARRQGSGRCRSATNC